jgi:site-specific DNA recombinase
MTRLRIVVILSEAKDLFVKICAVLDNEKYVGDILLMKTYTPEVGAKRRKNRRESEQYKMTDGHPSIITREAFAAVQEEKKRRSNLEIVENTPKRAGKRYMSKFSLQDYLNEISE